MKITRKLSHSIGVVSEWTGKVSKWIILIIVSITAYNVFMRYVLRDPTSWTWCTSYMLGACFIALGLAYNYSHKGNVRIDVIYSKFSPKTRLAFDVFFAIIFFFPAISMLAYLFTQDAIFAYSIGQVDQASVWHPLTWPFKMVVAIGFILLLLQGTATFLDDVSALLGSGKES